MVYVQSETTGQDGTTRSDLIIAHVFAPLVKDLAPPVSFMDPNSINLQPPAAPAGTVYVGRNVVIDGVLQEDLTTVPLDREPQTTDTVFIKSETSVDGGVTQHDINIQHVFAPSLPDADAPAECIPSAVSLEAPEGEREGYEYLGREVVMNGVLSEEYSTLPLDRPESPQEINRISSQTLAQDGQVTRDIVVRHVFAPIQHGGCPIDSSLYQRPTLPPCHRYVGYMVMVNHQLVYWSVPLERPFNPTDLILINSKTSVVDTVTQCDTVVCHVFEAMMPCPPKNTTVTFGGSYVAYESNGLTQLYVSSGNGQMSPEDTETLKALSVQAPYLGHQGDISIMLPPGTIVTQTGDQLTITLPEGF